MKTINLNITLSIFFSFLIILNVNAQNTITGKITNQNQEHIGFANVLLLNPIDSSLYKGTVANENGIFQMELPKDEEMKYLLHISMIGYMPFYQSVASNATLETLNIQLLEDAEMLNSVEIVAKKTLFTQEIDRMVINVQSSITSAGSNALEILSKSPSIQVDRVNHAISVMGKQGVMIMINGKRSRMDAQALMQLLESMPANNIQKIEVITTPPANFDAEGNAGIINIVLVKHLDDGFNGNIGGRLGHGLRSKMGVNTNFNFRKGKLNLYGDYAYSHELIQAKSYIGNTIVFGNAITNTVGESDRPAAQTFHNARIGVDYQLSDKTILGLLFSGHSTLWEMDAYADITTTSNVASTFYERLRSVESNQWLHGMTNFSISHQLNDDEKIDFNYDYLYYVAEHPTDYFNEFFDENQSLVNTQNFQSRKHTPIPIHVATIDYSKKINDKLSIETGLKGTISNFINDISVAYQEDNTWRNDEDYTNIFDLDERIGAAYVSSHYKINEKTTAKAGLRYEYFTAHLQTETNDNLVNRKSGNLFPSLFLSHSINDNNSLQLSYSRRIQRPSFTELAPALFFFGPNTIKAGNPNIQQTLSDNIKLDYRHKAYWFSLQYNYETAPIAFSQPVINAEKNQVVMQAANMDSRQMLTGTASLPLEVTKWWNMRWNVNGFWVEQNPIVDGQVIQRNNFTYSFFTSQEFKLPKDYAVALTGNYTSKFQYGIADIPVRWTMNLGIQKAFNQFKISFNWNDMFNTGSFWDMRINQPEINRVSHFRYELEGSIKWLSISYQFGKKDLKSSRSRRTGSEEERGRM